MNIEKLFSNQSIIVSLDIDQFLFERIQQVIAAGFSLIEINSTEEKLLQQIIQAFPDIKIGAGNIVTTQQLEQCYQAGVAFVSSPGYVPAIAHTALIYSMNYLPGVATVSEAMAALNSGYHQVRPFPATLNFCSLLNQCLPELSLYPGDVEWDKVEHFLNLPTVKSVSIHNPNIKQLNALSSVLFA